jgi:hypothetical protein
MGVLGVDRGLGAGRMVATINADGTGGCDVEHTAEGLAELWGWRVLCVSGAVVYGKFQVPRVRGSAGRPEPEAALSPTRRLAQIFF